MPSPPRPRPRPRRDTPQTFFEGLHIELRTQGLTKLRVKIFTEKIPRCARRMLPCTPGISDSRTHAPTLPGSCGGSITVDSVHGHSDPLDTVGSPPTHVIAVSYAIAAAYAAHSLETCGWNLRKVDWLNLEWVPACLQAKMLKPVGAYVLTAPEAPPPEVEQVEQSNPAGRLLLMGGGSSASSASYQKMIQKDGQTLSARLVGYENPADYDVGARADPGQHADQDPGWS